MSVKIDKAGDYQATAAIVKRQGGVLLRQAGKGPCRFSTLADEKPAGYGFKFI
jgi:hypothetical protein